MTGKTLNSLLLAALLLAGACAQVEPKSAVEELGGTSWRLVRFQGGDGYR